MATLTGLLDGETAAALKGLYGVGSSAEAPQAESEEANSWSDYDGSDEDGEFCDNCGEELTAEELEIESKDDEQLCGECDRRTHSHAVGRFVSTRSREKEFD